MLTVDCMQIDYLPESMNIIDQLNISVEFRVQVIELFLVTLVSTPCSLVNNLNSVRWPCVLYQHQQSACILSIANPKVQIFRENS